MFMTEMLQSDGLEDLMSVTVMDDAEQAKNCGG